MIGRNIIQKLIEAEKNGGAKGQIKAASEWPEDNFNLTLSYNNETQVFYAQKPVELLGGEEAIEVADKDNLDKLDTFVFSDIDLILIENQISPIANRMNCLQGMIMQYFIMIRSVVLDRWKSLYGQIFFFL